MAADYKLPLDVSKHVRFFDGQFLQDQDFIDEQKYHQSRRQRHYRTLHVAGVVEGLTVYKPDGSTFQVKVRPGSAIDADGRLIFLPDYSDAVELPAAAAGGTRWLYIAYHQLPSDLPSTSQGVEEETRWLDAPFIFAAASQLGIDDTYEGPDWNGFLAEGPPPPVLLARLTIAEGGAITIDESVRLYSGMRLPGAETLAPVWRTDGDGNVGLWQVDDNELTERLTISPEGNVGVNTTAPGAALEIGSTLKATKNGDVLTGMKIAPSYNENGKESVKKYGLIVTAGYVGIGTATPNTTLEVRGAVRGGTSAENYTEMSHGGSHGYINTVGNGRLDFRHDGSNKMVLTSGGELGIGIDSPGANLDVKGIRNTTGQVSLQLRSGNTSARFDSNQLAFSYNNTTNYRHAIKSRHSASSRFGNALDFYVWKYLSADDKDENADVGTLHTMTLDGGYAGIGTTSPAAKLHVTHETQDANGNALIVGPTNGANLRMGYHADYSWMQSHGGKPLAINPIGNNVGIATNDPGATLDVNGSFRANSQVSGERALIMEAPSSGDHRGDGNTQGATGLSYRVQTNPASGEPIMQVRSSAQAVRFFVEHDGWTGSRDNSAWFGGSYDNYFAGSLGVGTTDPQAKLHVAGHVRVDNDIVKTGDWGVTLGGTNSDHRVRVGELWGKSGVYGLDGLILGSNDSEVETRGKFRFPNHFGWRWTEKRGDVWNNKGWDTAVNYNGSGILLFVYALAGRRAEGNILRISIDGSVWKEYTENNSTSIRNFDLLDDSSDDNSGFIALMPFKAFSSNLKVEIYNASNNGESSVRVNYLY